MLKPKLTADMNGGKSRKWEIRKNPRKRDPKKRHLEYIKSKEKRAVENVELVKQCLYKCRLCLQVKPDTDYRSRAYPDVWKTDVICVTTDLCNGHIRNSMERRMITFLSDALADSRFSFFHLLLASRIFCGSCLPRAALSATFCSAVRFTPARDFLFLFGAITSSAEQEPRSLNGEEK